MKIRFDKSFVKALDKIREPKVLKRIQIAILRAEAATTLEEMPNVRKLTGHSSYYRMKVGDYRIGFEVRADGEILLITVLHRKEIYRRFP
jgi:mRNA interferase RelE/StbE